MNCEFCNKNFSNKSSLNHHQKYAKFCQKLREDDKTNEEKYICIYCNQTFSRKYTLDKHDERCSEKQFYDFKETWEKREKELLLVIENLKKDKDDLRKDNDKLHELLKTSISRQININNSINSNSNNILTRIDKKYLSILKPMEKTQDEINKVFEENYNEDVFVEGANGLAKFCYKHLVQSEDGKFYLYCSDVSRKIFTYIGEDGNFYKDVKALNFTTKITKPLMKVCKEILQKAQENHKIYNRIKQPINGRTYDMERMIAYSDIYLNNTKIREDNTEFLNHFSALCSNINGNNNNLEDNEEEVE